MLTKRDLLRSAALAAITAATAKSVPVHAQTSADRPGFFKAKDIAEAGFIYGLPIVMNYGVMYEYAVDRNSGQFKAPFNQIKNEPNVFTYKDTAIPTPNSDTPYSFVWMDLRAEPMVLSVPAVDPKRYYSVMLCDGNTYNYGYIGSRATGSEAGDYMVVGPDWKGATPPGIKKVFRSSTQFSLAGYRTQLFNPDDIDNVKKVQAGYKVQPLSAYLKQPAPTAAPAIDFPKIDKELVKTNFFEYLDFALQFAPAAGEREGDSRPACAHRRRAGQDLQLQGPLAGGQARSRPRHEGRRAKGRRGRRQGRQGDQRLAGQLAAGRQRLLQRRLAEARCRREGRASTATIAAEATYPLTRIDSDGQTLDGSKHNYTLTFPAGQLPPVNAFWSVTMYDGKTQLLIENPINRYLINSPMLPDMKTNADGSLTLYIQNKSPGADKEANWLPAPNDTIYLVMRLYWPKTEAPSILPAGEGTWQPPGIKRVA